MSSTPASIPGTGPHQVAARQVASRVVQQNPGVSHPQQPSQPLPSVPLSQAIAGSSQSLECLDEDHNGSSFSVSFDDSR